MSVPTTLNGHSYSDHAMSSSDVALYLRRLELPQSVISNNPSLSQLSTVLLAHHEQIPKDTSPLHIPEADWKGDPDADIVLGSSFFSMPLGVLAFNRMVELHRGAFCFGLNPTFSALLRALGFRVSEMVARCYQVLGQDPEVHEDGWKWGTLSHEVLVVDWEGSEGRYLVDVGFGGGSCAKPIPLEDGATIPGLNSSEAFKLTYGPLPLSPSVSRPIDIIPGYTLLRRVSPPNTPITYPITTDSPGYWSPLYHFVPFSVSLIDFSLYHHYSASHERAAFTAFLLLTKLIPGTGGARRSMMYGAKDDALALSTGRPRRAKVHTTGGIDGVGGGDRDVEYVEMKVGPMKEYLEREWGFVF